MKNKQTHRKLVHFLFLLEAHSGGVPERRADSWVYRHYLVLILCTELYKLAGNTDQKPKTNPNPKLLCKIIFHYTRKGNKDPNVIEHLPSK
jgi:hypothetical protein